MVFKSVVVRLGDLAHRRHCALLYLLVERMYRYTSAIVFDTCIAKTMNLDVSLTEKYYPTFDC